MWLLTRHHLPIDLTIKYSNSLFLLLTIDSCLVPFMWSTSQMIASCKQTIYSWRFFSVWVNWRHVYVFNDKSPAHSYIRYQGAWLSDLLRIFIGGVWEDNRILSIIATVFSLKLGLKFRLLYEKGLRLQWPQNLP